MINSKIYFVNNIGIIQEYNNKNIEIKRSYFKEKGRNVYEIYKFCEYNNEGFLIKKNIINNNKIIQINEYKNGRCINSKFI
jgi:hypothetical protein